MNSREAFEKWAERIGCSVSRMRTRRDVYVEYDTTALWDCWQAATERAAKVCEEIEVERTNYCMHVYEEGEQYKSAAIAAILEGNE